MTNHNFKNRDGSNHLDPDQIQGLKFSHITSMAELDELEDENIQRGINWLNHHKGTYLTIEFIKTLHKKLFADVWKWAGTFRKNNVNLSKINPYDIGLQLKMLFCDTTYWIEHKSMSWNEIAAEFHHRLVAIHPFPNGNGRISRIMTEYLQTRNNQEVTSWMSSLKDSPEERRTRYIQALQKADRGDLASLIEFMEEKVN